MGSPAPENHASRSGRGLVARGDTYVEIMYGSTSEWQNGEGVSIDVDFPFTVTMTAPIADMKNLSVVGKDIDVSSWYGAEEREEENGKTRLKVPR